MSHESVRRLRVGLALLAFGTTLASGEDEPRPEAGRLLTKGARVAVEVEDFGVELPVAEKVRLTQRQSDTLPGRIEAVDAAQRTLRLTGFTVRVDPETAIEREPDLDATFEDLRPGLRVKVEGRRDDADRFRAARVVIRRNQHRRSEKLVGPIERVERLSSIAARIRVLGRNLLINESTEVIDRRGRERPAFGWRIGTVDEDDLRMEGRIRLGRRVALSGETRFEGRAVGNPRLDAERDDSEAEASLGLILAMAADLGPLRAYVEGQLTTSYLFNSEDPFLRGEETSRIREAYVLMPNAVPRVSLALGRQKFDESREWYYNTRALDAFRVIADFFPVTVEASISRDLYDLDRDDDIVDESLRNRILRVHYAITGDYALEAFYIDRELRDLRQPIGEPRIVGLRFEGSPGRRWTMWADLARNTGTHAEPEASILREIDGEAIDTFEVVRRQVRGEALDVGVTWRPRVRFDPSLTVSYAYGSGESDAVLLCDLAENPSDCLDRQRATTERNYYPTGFERYNDRYNGRSSFRYYGVALDPVLSNLRVTTAAVGVRPLRRLSLDVIHHRYRQDAVSRRAFAADLKARPLGLDPHLGKEWDLVISYRPSQRTEFRLNGGVFRTGDAFDPRLSPDPITAAEEPPESTFKVVRFRARYRF